MKARVIQGALLGFLVPMLTACAADSGEPGQAPSYVSEAPLPKGWPEPGPYNQVSEKRYPAYRAAFTAGGGTTVSFWTLFMHIKKHEIPMTAPVEMAMEAKDDSMDRAGMAFLYQSGEVGKPGADGERVEVRDVPAVKVVNYTWQGPDSKENVARAREAIVAELAKRGVKDAQFRLLGYNGPGTPRAKATWELQAVLKD